ncbi:MAPK regulated corepressor interacting protein 2 isoform X1 [Talpa occidentalis]|uniref:MAPK regulated corepressor interacting protein 2 isoform X1 n=1 Tax=Talpa occidentalis TaxID=50954 RepID=UPI0023F8D174|nr:MAPK regulated corepressor interacting protein 2 isoform X1 [Talpa occidentalis]
MEERPFCSPLPETSLCFSFPEATSLAALALVGVGAAGQGTAHREGQPSRPRCVPLGPLCSLATSPCRLGAGGTGAPQDAPLCFSAPLSQGGPLSGGGAPEPRKASRPAGPRVPGGVAGAAPDSRLPLLLPGPRLVFNRVNGRRPPATTSSLEETQETYTPAHEENVRFVSEAWQQVERQLGAGQTSESGPRPVQYVERTPNPRLQNFVPIDLDEWWAQQFLARVTSCS